MFSAVTRIRPEVDIDELDWDDPTHIDKLCSRYEVVETADLALVLGQLDQFRGTAAAKALDR